MASAAGRAAYLFLRASIAVGEQRERDERRERGGNLNNLNWWIETASDEGVTA